MPFVASATADSTIFWTSGLTCGDSFAGACCWTFPDLSGTPALDSSFGKGSDTNPSGPPARSLILLPPLPCKVQLSFVPHFTQKSRPIPYELYLHRPLLLEQIRVQVLDDDPPGCQVSRLGFRRRGGSRPQRCVRSWHPSSLGSRP